tara:strand:- start:1289 stop:1558 length:270 start_codon:yes stop_codon:yes gene_type:complete
MTKEEILKLYIADLNNLVADSDAKRSRIIDLEDELEALNQGQTLPIDSVSNRRELLKSFADEAQEKMYEQPDNDLSDFIDDFLKDFYSC